MSRQIQKLRVPEVDRLREYIGIPISPSLKLRLLQLCGQKHGAMTDLARQFIEEGIERRESEIEPRRPRAAKPAEASA